MRVPTKCPSCGEVIYNKDLATNLKGVAQQITDMAAQGTLTLTQEFQFLTGDLNLVRIQAVVQYRVASPADLVSSPKRDSHLPTVLKPGEAVTLKAAASFLVCAEICVPEDATLSLTLPVTAGPVATFLSSFLGVARAVTSASHLSSSAGMAGRSSA